VGSRDIRTRVAHPESNGKVERLHRTHREEGLAGAELEDYHAGLRALARWTEYYNTERPHSALKYLPPVVYYRGFDLRRQGWRSRADRSAEEPGRPAEGPTRWGGSRHWRRRA
jgi:transposase InsO family protein